MNSYDVALALLNPTGYFIDQLKKNSAEFEKKIDSTELKELEIEAIREEIRSTAIQNAAKAEQEISIARRILAAEEVEIEEYYDGEVSGNAGLRIGEESLSLGLNGVGKKVTKRIIRFKGFGGELLSVKPKSTESNG